MSKKRRRAAARRLPVRVVPRAGGGVALTVGGVVQSISIQPISAARMDADGGAAPEGDALAPSAPDDSWPDGYWALMLPPACPRRALLLGLGGGTVAWLLAIRCTGIALVGVERDAEVLAVARAAFSLDDIPGLSVVETDAFVWVSEHAASDAGGYDLICLDLFEAGRPVPGALASGFLRQLATLLAPGGILTTNLMITARTPDQLRRLRRVFAITRERRLRGNLVVHARPLPPAPGDPQGAGITRGAPRRSQ